MLIRIVRMVFAPEFVSEFEELFRQNSGFIRAFPGCKKLELWQDEKYNNIFYTHSHWGSMKDLEAYRQSDLFNGVWTSTKKGFVDRPQAWSTSHVVSVSPTP